MKNTYNHAIMLACTCALAILLQSCHHRMAPTITAGEYNAQRNQTDYVVIPYGGVALPGKWTHGRYRKESRQQYFYNADSTTVSIAFGPCDKLGFPTNGATGYEFVKLYNKWETRYQEEVLHQKVKLVTQDSTEKYMVWQVYGDGTNQLNLCGARDCNCGECAFQMYTIAGNKLSDEQKVKFLQDLYLQKKQ